MTKPPENLAARFHQSRRQNAGKPYPWSRTTVPIQRDPIAGRLEKIREAMEVVPDEDVWRIDEGLLAHLDGAVSPIDSLNFVLDESAYEDTRRRIAYAIGLAFELGAYASRDPKRVEELEKEFGGKLAKQARDAKKKKFLGWELVFQIVNTAMKEASSMPGGKGQIQIAERAMKAGLNDKLREAGAQRGVKARSYKNADSLRRAYDRMKKPLTI
jgi:hypothetical protein